MLGTLGDHDPFESTGIDIQTTTPPDNVTPMPGVGSPTPAPAPAETNGPTPKPKVSVSGLASDPTFWYVALWGVAIGLAVYGTA